MSIWPTKCFAGKSVLVSGGASGIGAGIARAFLAEGAKVTVTGATQAEADKAASDMPGLTAHAVDVRDSSQIEAMMNNLDSLDHLVN